MRPLRSPALVLLLAGCTAGPASPHSLQPIVVVVMENKDYGDILGDSKDPFINQLASQYILATNYHAVAHPSLPNYLALIGGSTFDIRTNCTDCHVKGTNLVDQIEARGIPWKAYMEDLPTPCFKGAESGGYAKKHNPFMYFDDIANDPHRCGRVVPLTQLDADLAAHTLPAFSFITPNLCHDTHSCGEEDGDRFLSHLIPPILAELPRSGILFLTWDEGGTPSPEQGTSPSGCCQTPVGGHVITIVAGGTVPRRESSVEYNHYSLLGTIEDVWRLPRLANAACSCIRSLADLLS